MARNEMPLDGGGLRSSGAKGMLRRAFSRTPAMRVVAVAAILVFVLGAVYTAAGQDKSESGPRHVTVSVSGPSKMFVGDSASFTVSNNAAGEGYSLLVTTTSRLSDSSSCTRSGSWTSKW